MDPSAAACSAWKLCEPNTSPSVTVTGAVQVFPSSLDVTTRSAERGKRCPGTSLPTMYTATSEPSGAYASFGGDSPWTSIGPRLSRISAGAAPATETYRRPSLPPFGADTHATACLPVVETANIGAVPTAVGALSAVASARRMGEPLVAPHPTRKMATTVLAAYVSILIYLSKTSTIKIRKPVLA